MEEVMKRAKAKAPKPKDPSKSTDFHEYMAWLMTQPIPPFKPQAWYNVEGDIIEAIWKREEHYAEWINHQVTILRSFKTKEVIGVQVWALEHDGKNRSVSKLVREESGKWKRRVAAWRRTGKAPKGMLTIKAKAPPPK